MSLQLTTYLRLRASGTPVELAAEQSGIGLVEARLTEKAVEGGDLALPHVRARAPAREDQSTEKEPFMARDHENVRSADQTVAADQLRLFIERIERLKEEIAGLNDDVSDVFKEAKGQGYDKWAMREVIKLRALEPHLRQERDAILETYRIAIGLAA